MMMVVVVSGGGNSFLLLFSVASEARRRKGCVTPCCVGLALFYCCYVRVRGTLLLPALVRRVIECCQELSCMSVLEQKIQGLTLF